METILSSKHGETIPSKPSVNPLTQTDSDAIRLHYDIINWGETDIFPYSQYQVVCYNSDQYQNRFYIYCDDVAMAYNAADGQLLSMQGESSKIAKYINHHLMAWLEKPNKIHPTKTNWEMIQIMWEPLKMEENDAPDILWLNENDGEDSLFPRTKYIIYLSNENPCGKELYIQNANTAEDGIILSLSDNSIHISESCGLKDADIEYIKQNIMTWVRQNKVFWAFKSQSG